MWISLVGYSQTGARYRVEDEDGKVLVERSRNAEFDACRALLSKGVTGEAEFWRHDGSAPAMVLDIAKAAKRTVSEGDFGLRVVEWSPMAIGQGDDDRTNAHGTAIAAAASGQGGRTASRTPIREGRSKRPLASDLVAGKVAKATQAAHGRVAR